MVSLKSTVNLACITETLKYIIASLNELVIFREKEDFS